MKGLIHQTDWFNLIISGAKTIDVRTRNSHTRGTIGIIKKASKHVFGEIDLIDVKPLTEELFYELQDQHMIYCNWEDLVYKTPFVYYFENLIVYDKPIPYEHKRGCITWVNI